MATCASLTLCCIICVVIVSTVHQALLLKTSDVVFIVISQPNKFHDQRAKEFKAHFENQLPDSKEVTTKLVFTHEEWPNEIGAWTVLPLIKIIAEKYSEASWIFFCEDETRLNVKALVEALQKYDPSEKVFLGKALYDKEPTIIHHFSFFEDTSVFPYPDFAAGFVLSENLIKSLAERFADADFQTDFNIDAKHEFAKFIWKDGNGTKLENHDGFCTSEPSSSCITNYTVKFPDCGEAISEDNLYIAVKTCKQFHNDRVPIVKATWAKGVKNLEFISEEEDKSIPTISLGVPNTERGHCGKTMAIMKRFIAEENLKDKQWLLISDDDTIISIDRLRKFLACYDTEKPVALGERYGYGLVAAYGYNYITGGGGMVFNQAAAKALVESCECPSDDSPDDMILGMCLKFGEIPITHSALFHQARPDDYSEGYLKRQIPISFHKHWNNNPEEVYNTWFVKKEHDEL